ncbi:MAG: hypothetical protein N2559_13295 [Anaerolineae bacterium]|nr:hypothetical protein [Anaerolineae bacterium]
MLFIKNQKNTASFNSSSFVVSPTPSPADEKTKMLAHNFEEIYKNITQPQPDVLASSTLTNTYQGKIIKIRRQPGVLENVGYQFDLFIQLQGDKDNTKAMFFTREQIASMEKQGFSNVSDLKVGDTFFVLRRPSSVLRLSSSVVRPSSSVQQWRIQWPNFSASVSMVLPSI